MRLTLRRMAAAGISGSLLAEQTDTVLENLLFAEAGKKSGHRRHADPDWATIHRELKRKHVTLTIVWDEYIAVIRTAIGIPGSASFIVAGKPGYR